MRKSYLVIGGLTAALASASAANAADLYTPAPAAYSDAGLTIATDDWTGFYAGASVGAATTNDFSEGNTGWGGGVQGGYLHQFGQWVVGAELQATINDELTYELTPEAGLKQNWAVTAKARGGMAFGNTLVYNVVGAQVSELEGTGTATSGAQTYAGLAFGAGVEQKLTDNISVRAEYLQTRYFEAESAVAGVGRTDDLVNHAVTLGVNYKF